MIRNLKGKRPQIGNDCYIDDAAVLIGDVTIGDRSSVWPCAVLRGDEAPITVGSGSSVQDNCVLHGGASVGSEASITLGMEGKKCTVLEMAEFVNLAANGSAGDLEVLSEKYGVTRMLGWALKEIGEKSVKAQNVKTGEVRELPADTVLMAVGMRPRQSEALKFAHVCPETSVHIIGDASMSGDVRDAVFHAFEACRYI